LHLLSCSEAIFGGFGEYYKVLRIRKLPQSFRQKSRLICKNQLSAENTKKMKKMHKNRQKNEKNEKFFCFLLFFWVFGLCLII